MSRNRSWQVYSVRCPYYKEEESQKIICQGVEKGNLIHMTFSCPKQKIDFRRRFCQGNFKGCVIEAAHEEAEEE